MQLGESIRTPVSRGRRAIYLQRRISDISHTLGVNARFVPNNQGEIDRVHAFRLLAHSEIQSFLDGIAGRILDVTEDMSNNSNVLTHAGHHLLVYYALRPLDSAREAREGRYPVFEARRATQTFLGQQGSLLANIKRHRKLVSQNNGIKGGNIRRELIPLGFRDELFAPGLVDQLDSLGEARGDVAHDSGVTVGATSYPSGSIEWTRLGMILPGLSLLERYAPRLLHPA